MKKLIIILLIIVLSAALLSAVVANATNLTPKPTLCFNKNGEFTILQLSDFHEWAGIEQNSIIDPQDTLKPALEAYIRSTLDDIQPDFVVLTGDNIFNLSWQDIFLKISVKTITLIADIFEDKQTYWTFTFGNHDTEGATTKTEYIQAVKDYKYFIGGLEDGQDYKALSFQAADDDFRAGNYSIPIYSDNYKSIAYNLFVLDSGSYLYAPPSGVPYRYILDRQTEWYDTQAQALRQLNGGDYVPSLIFTHIPLIEHKEAYLQGNTSIGVWTGISPSDTRSSIMARALQNGDVKGIFTGHNHSNSYTGFYVQDNKSIMLGVTPQAAADSYDTTDATMYGRVIRLKQDGSFTTYIHTSDTQTYPDAIYRGETLTFGK